MNPTQLRDITLTASRHGLTGSNLAIALHIHEEPCGLADLARICGVSSAAMTGAADRLYLIGVAERYRPQGDRRMWYLKLTENGKRIVDEILTKANQ